MAHCKEKLLKNLQELACNVSDEAIRSVVDNTPIKAAVNLYDEALRLSVAKYRSALERLSKE